MRYQSIKSSQTIVNRIANIVFKEPRQTTGYAIFNLEHQKNTKTKNKSILTLLRFNERFIELLTAPEGEEHDRCESMLSDNELKKKQLTRILLEDYSICKSDSELYGVSVPSAEQLTFKSQFYQAYNSLKEDSDKSQTISSIRSVNDSDNQSFVSTLLKKNFYYKQGTQNLIYKNGLEI